MSPAETVPCECTEPSHGARPCVPVPAQHVRYQVRVGPENQGVVRLCAHCYVNGHLARNEYRWRGQQKAGQTT
jgi:hypothetical protein